MENLLNLLFIFMVGSILGYIDEFFFRRIVHKKWVNPGFLVGPYLPLYGTGLVILYLISSMDYSFIENDLLRNIVVIITIGILMTLIEYVTGLFFTKVMKIRLWDYHDRWLNIQGIICPLFSLFWLILGAIYYYLIHEHIIDAITWLTNNLIFSFFIGLFVGVFVIDIVYSFNIVNKVKDFAKEHEIVVKYEELKETIAEKKKEFAYKFRYVLPFYGFSIIKNELKEFVEKQKDKNKPKE